MLESSKTILSDRLKKTGAAAGLPLGGQTAASSKGEVKVEKRVKIKAHFEEAREIAARGRVLYENVRPNLEATAMGKLACINAETGEYILGDSIREVHDAFDRKFGIETPSWVTEVGNPDRVRSGGDLVEETVIAGNETGERAESGVADHGERAGGGDVGGGESAVEEAVAGDRECCKGRGGADTEIRTRGEIGEVTGVGEVVRPTCGETYPIDCIALVRGDIDTVAIESGGGSAF
jgi:hypothetical protein